MPTTYSTNLKISLMATGENSGTWGTVTNTNLGTLLEQAIVGAATVAMADSNQTISITDGASSDGRAVYIKCTGALTAGRNLVVPTLNKNYIVENATTGGYDITVKTTAGTGIAVKPSTKRAVYADATNVVEAISGFGALTTGALTADTVNGLTVTASTGTLTITNAKTLSASNTLTFTGTDGSSVDFGTGGSTFTKTYTQVFTSNGTYTPHAGMIFCIIECVGGGGAGGSVVSGSAGFVTSAGGGGSGGYSRLTATAATIGVSQTVTIGAGGSSSGVAGAATSVGSLCVANGGGGGSGGSNGGSGAGGAGATTVGAAGDITVKGSGGQSGFYATIITVSASTTAGGVGYFGGACDTTNVANSAGGAGSGYGSGGGGAYNYNTVTTVAGGAGANGVVVITEYCNQ